MTASMDRFLSFVDSSGGIDACHPWKGWRNNYGYGGFWADGRDQLAHRWLVGYLRGWPLGSNEYACHHCDNPPCCNPTHLYVGDAKTNMQDMATRGRSRYVEPSFKHNLAKTHCPLGHPYDLANTYYHSGWRHCRACNRAAVARYKARRLIGATP